MPFADQDAEVQKQGGCIGAAAELHDYSGYVGRPKRSASSGGRKPSNVIYISDL